VTPLDGVRVVDLTSNVSGPFVTMVLARLGADVVKVERIPAGDDARQFPPMLDGRSLIFEWCNVGKRSIALDAATPEGLDLLRRLVERADVLIHSFKPGVVDRLGIAEADVRQWNDDLLYCDISAFGHGPQGRKLKGYDPIVQAFSGIMDMTGYEHDLPARCAPSIIDLGNGQWMVIAVLAALLGRQRGDKVRSVESALVDSAMALVPWQATLALVTGERPVRKGTSHSLGAPYDLFQTKDRPIFLTAANPGLWLRLLELLGADHLAEDPRFGTPLERAGRSEELGAELAPYLATRTADEWMEEFHRAGIPASLVLGVDEAVRNPVAGERDWFEDVAGVPLVRLPILADGEPIATPIAAPRLGEHSLEVLSSLGLSAEEQERLLAAGVVSVAEEAP
jgi:crotonobetainyl-CoA:carnitine CoA-transferase CaiB-like acyl-CoA transferase